MEGYTTVTADPTVFESISADVVQLYDVDTPSSAFKQVILDLQRGRTYAIGYDKKRRYTQFRQSRRNELKVGNNNHKIHQMTAEKAIT